MTPEETRGGLRRLALVTAGLVACALALSALFLIVGARGRAAIAAGAGTLGILLIFAGIAAFAKSSPVRHLRTQPYADDQASQTRRETERLALGLFAYGVAFEAAALTLG